MTLPHYPSAWSQDRVYRYSLWRTWLGGEGYVQFIGLNPSTADETRDDPTLRRCIRYALDWGFSGMCMTNLFAYRATDPRDMKRASAPIGSLNDLVIREVAEGAGLIIACWGADGGHFNREESVIRMLGDRLHHLGLTQAGNPRHPLRLRADLKPAPMVPCHG